MMKHQRQRIVVFLLLLALMLAACAQGQSQASPPEIRYGETLCVQCNMIISDARFAAGYAHEISPGRYESLAFDDIGDMLDHASQHPEHKIVAWYAHDYASQEWLDATQAHFVFSNELATPMAQGTAAHASLADAQAMAEELNGQVLDWDGLRARHQAGDLMVRRDQEAAASGMMHEQGAMGEVILGEAEIDGYTLQLVSHGPLHAGYNVITPALRAGASVVHLNGPDGQPLEGAEVSYRPVMNMLDGMNHGSPLEQPVQEFPGMYHGAVVFSVPGGPDLGSWTLAVGFEDPASGVSGEASFDVDVSPSKLHSSFMTADERKIFVAVVSPSEPTVGKQPLELLVFEKASMMDWPTLDDLALEITPQMPTMGHGSPGNENPLAQGNGHYLGQVNFTMSGPWTVTVFVKGGDEVLGQVAFEFAVP